MLRLPGDSASAVSSWHEDWADWVEPILLGTVVAQMPQVTLSSGGNFQPSVGVMLEDVV